MPNLPTSLEIDLHWLCAVAGLATLAYSLYNMLLAQSRPSGHHTGSAHQVLRTRYLVVATLLFLFFGYLLWKPIPLPVPWLFQRSVSLLGATVFQPAWSYINGGSTAWAGMMLQLQVTLINPQSLYLEQLGMDEHALQGADNFFASKKVYRQHGLGEMVVARDQSDTKGRLFKWDGINEQRFALRPTPVVTVPSLSHPPVRLSCVMISLPEPNLAWEPIATGVAGWGWILYL